MSESTEKNQLVSIWKFPLPSWEREGVRGIEK
jgi:hypothetical protein